MLLLLNEASLLPIDKVYGWLFPNFRPRRVSIARTIRPIVVKHNRTLRVEAFSFIFVQLMFQIKFERTVFLKAFICFVEPRLYRKTVHSVSLLA